VSLRIDEETAVTAAGAKTKVGATVLTGTKHGAEEQRRGERSDQSHAEKTHDGNLTGAGSGVKVHLGVSVRV